jgi:hypothetical protein
MYSRAEITCVWLLPFYAYAFLTGASAASIQPAFSSYFLLARQAGRKRAFWNHYMAKLRLWLT